MTISGRVFFTMEVDFTGKNTTEERQRYLEDIAVICEKEYEEEIQLAGSAEFFCEAGSRMQYLEITDFDILQLEIKQKAARFNKQTQNT